MTHDEYIKKKDLRSALIGTTLSVLAFLIGMSIASTANHVMSEVIAGNDWLTIMTIMTFATGISLIIMGSFGVLYSWFEVLS